MNTTELVNQVRGQIDEFNQDSVTDEQILDALNRGQRAVASIMMRKYAAIFARLSTLSTISGDNEYEMPRDIYGQNILKVELEQGSVIWQVKHISYKDRHPYVITSQVTRPYYYDIIGHKIRLYPKPQGDLTIYLHYSGKPETLVPVQGQINYVDTVNNTIILDEMGQNITTESDKRNSYLSIIDHVTGDVKGTLQVATVTPGIKQVKFKSTGVTRTTVLDKTISTSLPTDISVDDYVCTVHGTAVPQIPEAYQNYLIQYATSEIRRRFGEPVQEELVVLQNLEKELHKVWAGRETSMRVSKVNNHLGLPLGEALRRFFA